MNDNYKCEFNLDDNPIAQENTLEEIAETSIVKMIITGSGGPENNEIEDSGLRFVRFLMSQAQSYSTGILPNLKDPASIRHAAKDYIRHCGTASKAMQLMYQNS